MIMVVSQGYHLSRSHGQIALNRETLISIVSPYEANKFDNLFIICGRKKVNNNKIFWQIKTPLDN